MSLLHIDKIQTGYGNKEVLFDISLQIEQGETVLLAGSNGSGKSTLLKAIYGLLPLWAGNIYYYDRLIHTSDTGKKILRKPLILQGVVYIPQKNELFADMTVAENLTMCLLHLNDKNETQTRIEQLMIEIPLLKERYRQTTSRLSGGEAKLLTLGMALVNRPSVLLYDEPLAGLSGNNIDIMQQNLIKLKEANVTMIIVEHKIKEIFAYSDRVVGLKLGRLYTEKLDTLDNIKHFMI